MTEPRPTSDHDVDPSQPDRIGRIGRYRILRKVGEGGMGRVYEAEQDNPRRIVALKVIRAEYAGPELLKRFEHEAQALGRLHHPGIAQIYEAGSAPATPGIGGPSGELGTTGSVPFFAMELVRGLPLDDYVAGHALSVPARLALFVRICEAVQHAHHNGVIHRDLKPANILVDESGQPKILDFGLARLTNSDVQAVTMQTDVGQLLGTLSYMSPEQVAANPLELDTRSDVYALGVILYQMLSGQLPHDVKQKMLHEAVRAIREDDPRPLSSIDRVFRGDIETIVAKALEKEKERRYSSPSELATDIGRYLRDEPIVARRPSAAYQLRKFAVRNRILVGGIVAVFVVLVIGVVASTLLALRAIEAEQLARTQLAATEAAKRLADTNAEEARTEAAKSAAVSSFLSEMLQAADPGISRDREVKVRQILDQAAARVDAGSFAGQVEVEASVRQTLGKTYSAIGEFEPAEKHLRAALTSLSSLVPARAAEVADCSYELALVLNYRGRHAEGSSLVEKALETHKRSSGEESVKVANDLALLASIRYNQTRRDEAQELGRRAVEIRKAVYGERDPRVAAALSSQAFRLMETRDLSAAKPLLDEAVDILERAGSTHEVELASVLKQRGRLRRDDRSYAAAETDLRRALEIYRRIYGDDHYTVADILDALGTNFLVQIDPARAEPLVREALEIRRKILGDHRDTATSLAELATIAYQRGDIEQALGLSYEALEMRRRLFGEDNAAVADSLWRIADLLTDKGDLKAAEPLLRRSIEGFKKTIGEDHPDTTRPMLTLSRLLRRTGGLEEAESLLRRCVEINGKVSGELSSSTMEMRDDLIQVLFGRKEWIEAETLLRDILPKYESKAGAASPLVAFTRIQLGTALAGQKRFDEAEPLMIDNISVIIGNKQLWAETKRMSATWVADFYEAAGDAEEAAKWREEAAKWKR